MAIEKEALLKTFFKINGNEHIEELQTCKLHCEEFLKSENDSEISDLINIIDALIFYFKTSD